MSERPSARIATYGKQLRWTSIGVWAALAYLSNDEIISVSGYEHQATRNQMGFHAILHGLRSIPFPSDITVQTDLPIAAKALSNEWRLVDAKLVVYYDSIMEIVEHSEHRIQVVKVPSAVVSAAKRIAIAGAPTQSDAIPPAIQDVLW